MVRHTILAPVDSNIRVHCHSICTLLAIGNFTHNKSRRIKLSSAETIAFHDPDEYTLREAMARQYISDDLKAFIKDQVQTVFRLGVLLLLHGEQSKSFTPAEVALALGFETDVAQEQLRSLARLGLLVQSNTDEAKYSYHPANLVMGSIIDQLALTYSKRPVPILSLLLTERTDRARAFAEAFRLIKGNH